MSSKIVRNAFKYMQCIETDYLKNAVNINLLICIRSKKNTI